MLRLILRSAEGIANSLEAISIMRYLEAQFGREAVSSIRFPRDQHTKRLMGYATVSFEPEVAEQLLAAPEIVVPTRQNVQSDGSTLAELYRSKLRLKNVTEPETSTVQGRTLILTAETMGYQGPIGFRSEPLRSGMHDQELQDLLITFDGFATPGRLRPGWKKRAEREQERAQRKATATANTLPTKEASSP